MKRISRFLMPLAALGILFLAGCDSDTDMAELMDAGEYEQTYDISGEYAILNIQVDLAELTIRTGEEASMEVHMDKWYKIEDVLQDDTLYLTEKNDGPFWRKFINFGSVNNSILITLPEDAVEQLIVSSGVGDIAISDQVIENMSVSDSNGNIIISDCQSTTVETDNSNGNITVSDVKIPVVDVRTKNGDVIFEKTETDSITVNSANGSIALELMGDEKSYNYKIGSTNGKIAIGKNSFGSVSKELTLVNDADKDVVLDSANGSCTITFFQKSE